MGGLAVLFLLGLYFVLTVVAIAKAKPVWVKGLVLLAALLIPTADAVYGRYKLKQMCAAEAGLKVYRVAHGVEGFMDDYGDYWVKEGKYQFSEDFPTNGKVTRYSKQNGQIVREDNVSPQSLYRVNLKRIGDTKDTYLRRQFVIDTIQGEILAADTQIAFNGGWAERFLAQFSDAGGGTVAWCANTKSNPLVRHQDLVFSTLKHSGE
ncbi:MAG: hypothetical protein Q8L34_06955 [Candidatus Woesearchaeota archaeon]|nr:hypothetical protein [Candidatus Woesearchaeota archaeon]